MTYKIVVFFLARHLPFIYFVENISLFFLNTSEKKLKKKKILFAKVIFPVYFFYIGSHVHGSSILFQFLWDSSF